MTETCTLTVSKTNVSTTANEPWEEEEEATGQKERERASFRGVIARDCRHV